MILPLEGVVVLEFAQFMAGPSAGLKLADLGARVIKIERPGAGESGRKIAIKNLFIGDDSLVFHTINRNKESIEANLKDEKDLAMIRKLLLRADILLHNFRPGVMEKIGLDYDSVKRMCPTLIYGEITGYGKEGPWTKKPGQDLLVQSVSGLAYLSGNRGDAPTPMGIAVSDMLTGAHLVQGILAAMIQLGRTGQGTKVSVSLLESTLDFQFEGLTTYLNSGMQAPIRAEQGNANAFLGAPYGIYQTSNGYMAVAMVPLARLTEAMQVPLPAEYREPTTWFDQRDAIMRLLASYFIKNTTDHWLEIFDSQDLWCMPVLDYKELLEQEAYRVLRMDQEVVTKRGEVLKTTRCPIRIDGERMFSSKSAPEVGEDNAAIRREFDL